MIGRPAADLLRRARRLLESAATLRSRPTSLRDRIREQVEAIRAGRTHAVLRGVPLDSLRSSVARGTRLQNLQNAGYRSVADAVAATPAELIRVPGVGPHSAEQVHRAARARADEVRAQVRVVIDAESREPDQTELLATLAAARRADVALSDVGDQLAALAEQIEPLLEAARRTSSRARTTFSTRTHRREALRALAQVNALLAQPRVGSLERDLDEALADGGPVEPAAVWDAYVADAASYQALLSTLNADVVTPDDEEAGHGYAAPDVRRVVSATHLDASLLRSTLRGYQVFGAQYAIHQNNAMLGDEMGLGKTIQALAAVAHLAASGQTRFLVVCPASVLANWVNEIDKHTRLEPVVLHGAGRDAAARRWAFTGGIGVTTFSTVGRLVRYMTTEMAMVVVDEAHYVKNPATQRSQAVAAVLANAQRTLFLTGTPMENRVEEFRCLVGYLQPQLASTIDARDAVAGARQFRRAVSKVYLRRNQEDVLAELPEKIEIEDWVYPSVGDVSAYSAAVRTKNLMAMRQAAYHAPDSAKLERLATIVDEAREDGLKVVVFSYFLGVLDVVGRRIGSAVVGAITGKDAPAARQHLVDTFTRWDGPAVLLCQIEAGGVGLNIQAASVVILAEPQFKPSTEDQAVARAHRMGQVRRVQVHRLLTKDSVDERMEELKEGKRLLFDSFARRSDAKDADVRAVDDRPVSLDDEAIPGRQRILLAEQYRLGLS